MVKQRNKEGCSNVSGQSGKIPHNPSKMGTFPHQAVFFLLSLQKIMHVHPSGNYFFEQHKSRVTTTEFFLDNIKFVASGSICKLLGFSQFFYSYSKKSVTH